MCLYCGPHKLTRTLYKYVLGCFSFSLLFSSIDDKFRIILLVSDFHPWQNGGVAEGAVLSARVRPAMYLDQASLNKP